MPLAVGASFPSFDPPSDPGGTEMGAFGWQQRGPGRIRAASVSVCCTGVGYIKAWEVHIYAGAPPGWMEAAAG